MPPYTEQQRWYLCAASCGPPVDTRFTITSGIAGQGYWYNRRSGSMVGSAVGDLSIPGLNDINRFGINTGDLFINKGGGGSFANWVVANPGFEFRLTFLDAMDREIVLAAGDLDGTPGGNFIRFVLTPAQIQIVNTVSVGSRIQVVITP